MGTSSGTDCPAGTFMNATGSAQLSDCIDCLQGHYCMGVGNIVPTGPCDVGYYCEVGETVAAPPTKTCSPGESLVV